MTSGHRLECIYYRAGRCLAQRAVCPGAEGHVCLFHGRPGRYGKRGYVSSEEPDTFSLEELRQQGMSKKKGMPLCRVLEVTDTASLCLTHDWVFPVGTASPVHGHSLPYCPRVSRYAHQG